jgi:hypothetical protein
MEIKENGGWVQNDDGWTGHEYIEPISEIIKNIILNNKPSLVYDFGCGWGHYISNINDLGIEAIGFEAYPDKRHYENIKKLDLSKPVLLERKADVSISLEVGEHIPVDFEQTFIDNVCNNTNDTIIFSWAVEGQKGDGHINCRNNDYIIEQVEKRGFQFDDSILKIRHETNGLMWFHNSLMLFNRKK